MHDLLSINPLAESDNIILVNNNTNEMGKNKLSTSFYLLILMLFTLSSCNPDEDGITCSPEENVPEVTEPVFDKFLSTTDTDGFSIRVRFKTGGDKESNIHATVYWKAYSKKPASTPSKNALTEVESMRQYGSATYHNTGLLKGMTESIVFDKSHAGYDGGTYIYYYVKCQNSVGSDESKMSYTIVKR